MPFRIASICRQPC